MKYMLDTNMLIFLMRNRPVSVAIQERIARHNKSEICISVITLAELELGVCRSSNPQINTITLSRVLSGIAVLPFDASAAAAYGEICADLYRRGLKIGAMDTLIAAHAASEGLTLVTNNTREFERVKGLTIEDWVG
ncbi:MAG: type II toxin-antitoxin system VapC family toxin [Oscillospiraceae bacterium]|jgi:tRNA(fMet)-specific endonuclease VapC|nr:type II toxin-antitoxin system VapC family toxin [Oscillospiraceae bacterium]